MQRSPEARLCPALSARSFGAFQPPVLLEGLEQFRLFSPSVSDDQLTLVYAAGVPASVYVATRPTEAARFSAGTLLPQVNSSGSDVTPHLSFDALSLVFASDRAGRPGLRDLMWTTRATVNSDFSPPTFLDEVNSLSNADKLGRLSSDQLTLQFTSNRPGGLGGDDLWRAVRRTQAEAFSMPTPMLELNSVNEDSGAVLSESGLEVFLASDRGSPLGTKDLFVATRAAPEVPFSTPVPVDALNSLGWDGDPALSRTGEVIYFSSDRLGSNQIWTSTRSCTE